MKTDRITKAASILLIFLFLGNDIIASIHAIARRDLSLNERIYHNNLKLNSEAVSYWQHPYTSEVKEIQADVRSDESPDMEEYLEFHSGKSEGYLGDHDLNPLNKPAEHFFDVQVSSEAKDYKYVYLHYSIEGLKDGYNVPKSINNEPTYYDEELDEGIGWQKIQFKVDKTSLKTGLNLVRFALPSTIKSEVTIKDVKLVFTNEVGAYREMNQSLRHKPEVENFEVLPAENNEMSPEAFVVSEIDMPSLPTNLINVTRKNWGYYIDGDYKKGIRVSIGVDEDKLLKGSALSEVKIFYFDEVNLNWAMVNTDHVDMASAKVEGLVPEGTNYFAGLIKTPEMPEASAYLPTAISGVEAANPAAGMNIMQPPSISPTGEASIQYPLDIPAGRAEMTPSLALTYSSDAGTGWLGVGWNIGSQSITIDTRWGVPDFPNNVQEEVYLLNGKSLSMEGEVKGNRGKVVGGVVQPNPRLSKQNVRFFERTINSYKEIHRVGTSPLEYCWVEILSNQTKNYYGTLNGEDVNNAYVLRDGGLTSGNILKWYLAKTVDKWGNTIHYTYTKTLESGNPNPIKNGGQTVTISKIEYTGFGSVKGKYSIEFNTSDNRTDATVSLKSGTKELDDLRLENIRVLYGSTEVKRFEFDYVTGKFKKTRLVTLREMRSGLKFYEHHFDYYNGDLEYQLSNYLNINHFNNKLFDGMSEDILSLAGPLGAVTFPSPIKTTTTTGWSAGGSTGVGLGPGPISNSSKTYSFSGRLSYSETESIDKLSMNDFNGDGLPDLVYDKGRGPRYYPLSVNESGLLKIGQFKRINFGGDLLKNNSNSLSSGFDMVLPFNSFYYGMNWNNTQSNTSMYVVDYNSDGIKDVVQPNNDGKCIVHFGKLTPEGDLHFNTSSSATVNPILKGLPVDDVGVPPLTKDFEIVRTWEAPFTGNVDISGLAEISSGLTGEVAVRIQKNGQYIPGSSWVLISPSNSQNIIHSNVAVTKGDLLLFRARCDQNGQQDLLNWDPQVVYRSPNLNKADANGINYSDSKYSDGFLISATEGVSFSGDQAIGVEWPSFSLGNFSDDVVLRVKLNVVDSVSGDVKLNENYEYIVPAGATSSPVPGNFKDANNSTPAFLQFVSTTPMPNPAYDCLLTFEVWSTSNIEWKDINWRPEVKFGTSDCQVKRSHFPVVFKSTFNRVKKLESPFNSSSLFGYGDLRSWPEFSFGGSDLQKIFTTEELNASSVISYVAYLTTKSDGNLLSKMAIEISNSGAITYRDLTANGALGSVLSLNSSPSTYSFTGSQVVNNEIYLEFFSRHRGVGEFLLDHISSVNVFEIVDEYGELVEEECTFSVFCQDLNPLQDYHLHWGQFCWSEEEASEISILELEPANLDIANENDYSGSNIPTTAEMEALDQEALNPLNQTFFMLGAMRGEKGQSRIRNYIKSAHDPLTAEKLDRWSAWGTHMACYAQDGAVTPGKLGEPQKFPPTGTPATYDLYSAYAITQRSSSNSLGQTVGAGKFTVSSTVNIPALYFSQSFNSYMDVNGDGYPDILDAGDDLTARLTGPVGGYDNVLTYSLEGTVTKSLTENSGLAVAGQFLNEDARFMKQGNVNGSATFGGGTNATEWLDINGDGLVDRISDAVVALAVDLNSGKDLQNTIPVLNAFTSSSKSFTSSFGLGLSNLAPKGGLSFSIGAGINDVSSETQTLLIDVTGDGLPDMIAVSGSSIVIGVNTGTTFEILSANDYDDANIAEINESHAIGISGTVAATYAFPLVSTAYFHMKGSVSVNGQANFSVNELESSFMDMNGDGHLDYIVSGEDGNLTVFYSKMKKHNLLKSVNNPIGGSFTINYKRVGNKYGLYNTKVKIHNTKPDEKMMWDMPESKWVMSELKVFDGLNLLDGSSDLDGIDTLIYTFNYDGGLKSRREREFLGFSRIEKVNPANIPEPILNGKDKEYISEVTEYNRATKNDYNYRKRFEYLKGIATDQFTLHNIEKKKEVDLDPGPGTEIIVEHIIRLMTRKKNDYEYWYINQDAGDPAFNKLTAHEVHDWDKVAWSSVSEAACIFPALVSTETISIPQTANSSKFHAVKYDIKYDDYMNVVEYSNEGVSGPGQITTQITDTIVNRFYEYKEVVHSLDDLLQGNPPFKPASFTDPDNGDDCYIIAYDGPEDGFSDDTLCAPTYLITDPCDLVPPGDTREITSVHRRLVEEVIYVEEEVFTAPYSGRIIAIMNYFDPLDAAGQTGMLKRHRVYLGSVPGGLERDTEVDQLQSGKAPSVIWNHLSGTEKAVTEITYSTKGNVTMIKAPANHAAQRLQTNFNYDGDVEQFVVSVSNSYGDNACYKYDFATGNLLKMEGINGHPTQYVYDDFYRVIEIYAPRDLAYSSGSPSISFEYYPEGIDNSQNAPWQKKVPVAITSHAINGVDPNLDPPVIDPDPPAPTVDCTQLLDLSNRPEIYKPLKTATFIDGLQRVVQVKKDVSKGTSSNWLNTIQREVSGKAKYDSIGRTVQSTLSTSELIGGAIDLGELNTQAGELVSKMWYDYANRNLISEVLQEGNVWNKTIMEYDWDNSINSTDHFYNQVFLTTGDQIKSKSYTDAWGRNIATVQDPGGIEAETFFEYDALNQLESTMDPLGVETFYYYDRFGRLETEIHDDRGASTYEYDMAGNVVKMITPLSTTAGITMTYDYNRLKTKSVALTPEVSDVVYTYGTLGDGFNGAGRVVKVVQGTNYKTEEYKYDELGNMTYENKIIKVPQAGQRTFSTYYSYDSWGRLLNMVYPDGELVSYSYNESGDLERISAKKGFDVQLVIDKMVYDGFGNTSAIKYGNGAITTFDYDMDTRRLKDLLLVSNGNTLLDKDYSYDHRGNVDYVENFANQVQGMGGKYKMTYTYDDLNRLLSTNGDYNGVTNAYDLDMTYNKAGGIIQKDQNYTPSSSGYNLEYAYNTKLHQLKFVRDLDNPSAPDKKYSYNAMGSITEIYETVNGVNTYDQQFIWTEEQSLMGVDDNSSGIQHYTYDHNGVRILKTSVREIVVAQEGNPSTQLEMNPYTVYVNPYYVATHYASDVEASKHYYMGAQRVATGLINHPFVAEEDTNDPDPEPGGGQPESGNSTSYGATINLQAVLSLFGKTDGVDYQINDLLTMPAITGYYYDDETAFNAAVTNANESEYRVTRCNEDPQCLCEISRYWAKVNYGIDCSEHRVMYWYHPDYLGNNEFITDLNGDPYQYFLYSPWGESLESHHRHNNPVAFAYDSPYRFNGKEYDAETGNYYYGARYYDPKVSVWLSVDPLAHEYPSLSPYTFVANNPIMLIDPDGRHIDPSELMKSEDHAQAFVLFAKSEEGKAFLDQFASEGQELSYNGEVYYKSEEAGAYDKKGVDLNYGLSGQDKRSYTRASSIGKGENEEGLISIKIANEGFGSDSKTFNLAGAIGHESFLHAEYFKDDLNMDYSNIPAMYRKYGNHAHHVYSSELYKQNPGDHSFSNNMVGLLKSVNSQLGCNYSDRFISSYTWKFAGSTVKK